MRKGQVAVETLKILWMNWRDIKNPDAGGAEVFTHEVAKRLAAQGHQVTLFTSEFPGSKREEIMDGVEVIRSGGKYTVYLNAKKHYRKVFSREDYDLVIDEINTRPFLTPKFVKKGIVIGLIHQLAREYWFYETPFPISYIGYHYLEKSWLRPYVTVPMVTVSESTRADLKELGFMKVYVVAQGLSVTPLPSLPEKEEKPTLIFIGRLRKAKLPDHAIKAYESVSREIPETRLWMVGDGYLFESLKNQAPSGVKFFGKVTNEVKLDLLKRAHLMLMPGIREGWGLVVTEANAMGTPVIAYDVPGLRDSVRDDVTGRLVSSGDISGISREALDLIVDQKQREILATNALDWSKNFSWNRTAREFMEYMTSVIQDLPADTDSSNHN